MERFAARHREVAVGEKCEPLVRRCVDDAGQSDDVVERAGLRPQPSRQRGAREPRGERSGLRGNRETVVDRGESAESRAARRPASSVVQVRWSFGARPDPSRTVDAVAWDAELLDRGRRSPGCRTPLCRRRSNARVICSAAKSSLARTMSPTTVDSGGESTCPTSACAARARARARRCRTVMPRAASSSATRVPAVSAGSAAGPRRARDRRIRRRQRAHRANRSRRRLRSSASSPGGSGACRRGCRRRRASECSSRRSPRSRRRSG